MLESYLLIHNFSVCLQSPVSTQNPYELLYQQQEEGQLPPNLCIQKNPIRFTGTGDHPFDKVGRFRRGVSHLEQQAAVFQIRSDPLILGYPASLCLMRIRILPRLHHFHDTGKQITKCFALAQLRQNILPAAAPYVLYIQNICKMLCFSTLIIFST